MAVSHAAVLGAKLDFVAPKRALLSGFVYVCIEFCRHFCYSVSDKTGLIEFAQKLVEHHVELVSTGSK